MGLFVFFKTWNVACGKLNIAAHCPFKNWHANVAKNNKSGSLASMNVWHYYNLHYYNLRWMHRCTTFLHNIFNPLWIVNNSLALIYNISLLVFIFPQAETSTVWALQPIFHASVVILFSKGAKNIIFLPWRSTWMIGFPSWKIILFLNW